MYTKMPVSTLEAKIHDSKILNYIGICWSQACDTYLRSRHFGRLSQEDYKFKTSMENLMT